jgi:Fic family protein
LLDVSTQGNWRDWFSFFLDVVAHQARDALQRARHLHDLRAKMRDQVATGRASVSVTKLVDALFDVPVLTVPRAQKLLGVTYRAASLNVEKLVDIGILREAQRGRRPRLFVATAIMEAVERV